jgi:hypothetical protein
VAVWDAGGAIVSKLVWGFALIFGLVPELIVLVFVASVFVVAPGLVLVFRFVVILEFISVESGRRFVSRFVSVIALGFVVVSGLVDAPGCVLSLVLVLGLIVPRFVLSLILVPERGFSR